MPNKNGTIWSGVVDLFPGGSSFFLQGALFKPVAHNPFTFGDFGCFFSIHPKFERYFWLVLFCNLASLFGGHIP